MIQNSHVPAPPVHGPCRHGWPWRRSALLVAGQLASMSTAFAAPPAAALAGATFVDLGTAASYSVLGGTGVANTGAGTVLSGDLGLSPGGVIAGFPPGTVHGTHP